MFQLFRPGTTQLIYHSIWSFKTKSTPTTCVPRMRSELSSLTLTTWPEQRRERKLPDTFLKRREHARLLGILDSDNEQDPSTPTTERDDSERRHKQALNESELDRWDTFCTSSRSREPSSLLDRDVQPTQTTLSGLLRLALNIYSIHAMSSEYETFRRQRE